MKQLNCAVIGVGYLGRFHAQKYKQLPNVNLIAVCDNNIAICDTVSNELATQAIYDYKNLFHQVDAVSIVADTRYHYQIAKDCLEHGLHVLIEKPITEIVEQADILIKLAAEKNLILQAGHLERFNPVYLALQPHVETPLIIEAKRLAPFNRRGSDVNVLLDLMIHDIELIQNLINSPIQHIDAQGTTVVSTLIDIATARIVFENQCVANFTASRISGSIERETRIIQKNSYAILDYHKRIFSFFTKSNHELYPGIAAMDHHQQQFDIHDSLLQEITSFVDCILHNKPAMVTGTEARNALATALQMTDCIHNKLTTTSDATR